MNDVRADEQLVADHLAGDRSALAGIYDRYGGSLYDTAAVMVRDRHEAADVVQDVFLIAAQRLDQLRDATRLKPWLFAVLRNQVFARSKRNRRTSVTDFSAPEHPEMAASIDPSADAAALAAAELASAVRSAAAGLDERDQLVLEYSVRQGLTGADLADALGVSAEQSYVMVHRMRERVQRSLGAFTVARAGRADCTELATILRDWDGAFNVLIRKRVARHIESCATCEATKHRFALVPMIGAAPVLAAPLGLRDRVLAAVAAGTTVDGGERFDADSGFPGSAVRRHRRPWPLVAAAVVAAVLLLGGGMAIALRGSDGGEAGAEALLAPPVATAAAPDGSSTTAAADDAATTTDAIVTSTSSVSSAEQTDGTAGSDATAATSPAATADTIPAVPTTAAAPVPAPPIVVAPTSPPAAPPATAPPPAVVPAPVPGQLAVRGGPIDFGSSSSVAPFDLANDGGTTLQWSLDPGTAAPFVLQPASGELAPGQTVVVTVLLDRASAPEGSITRNVQLSSSSGPGTGLAVQATVDRAPSLALVQGPSAAEVCPQFPDPQPVVVVSAADESPLSVVLGWSGPGPSGSTPMQGGPNWSGQFALPYVEGIWSWSVTATDARGNSTTTGGAVTVNCPEPG